MLRNEENKMKKFLEAEENNLNKDDEKTAVAFYFKSELTRLLENSTWQGVPNILRAQNTLLRLVWSLAFLLAFAYSVYSIVIMLINYLDFNVLITFQSVQRFDAVEFPAVTICNQNGVDYSSRSNLDKMLSLLQKRYGPDAFY